MIRHSLYLSVHLIFISLINSKHLTSLQRFPISAPEKSLVWPAKSSNDTSEASGVFSVQILKTESLPYETMYVTQGEKQTNSYLGTYLFH